MKRKSTSILALFLVISTLFSCILIVQFAGADTVTSVTSFPGVVNCLINFTSLNTDTYRVYFDDAAGIDASDEYQFDYGADHLIGEVSYNVTYQGTAKRVVILRGLDEDTTYYYKIYDVDTASWATTAERSFTTLSRFTEKWEDEFFDDYFIEQNSSIKIDLEQGTKYGSAIIGVGSSSGNNAGWHNFDIYKEGTNDWKIFATGVGTNGLVEKRYYMHSTDGITWSSPSEFVSSPTWVGTSTTRLIGSNVNDSGVWKMFFCSNKMIGANKVYFLTFFGDTTASNGNGVYDISTPLIVTGQPYCEEAVGQDVPWLAGLFDYAPLTHMEAHVTGLIVDTLGANKFYSLGQVTQENLFNGYYRALGYFIGINDTLWYMFNEDSWDTSDHGFYIEDKTPLGTPTAQHYYQSYYAGLVIRSGCYVMANNIINQSTSSGAGTTAHDNLIRPYLFVSRNGYNDWNSVNITRAIADPVPGGASWDNGMLKTAWGGLIVTSGNYDYIYYTQCSTYHANMKNGQTVITRLQYRKQGVTSLAPTSPTAWFRTVEIPDQFTSNFTVNGAFTPTSTLDIEVLDSNTGLPFSGFTFGEFDTITTDSLSHTPTWGGKTLDDIPSRDFKLNFSFSGTGGKLYYYSMDALGFSSSDTPDITAIEGLANNSAFTTHVPEITFLSVADEMIYHLMISNVSSFATVISNIADISAANYPTRYTVSGVQRIFKLPDGEISSSDLGSLYFKMRAKVKRVTG